MTGRATLRWLVLLACLGATAVAMETNTAPILQLESGGHTAICTWVGFTPDGRTLVSAGHDKVVRVWDLSGVAEAVQRFRRGITNGPTPHIPLVRSLRTQIGPGNKGKLHAGAISPRPLPGGGWLLAVGGYPVSVGESDVPFCLFDMSSGRMLGLLRGHSNVILSLAFSPDGRWLASGSHDATVRVWDLGDQPGLWPKAADGTLRVASQVMHGHSAYITGLTFVPGSDGPSSLASSSADKTIRLWPRDRAGAWGRPTVLAGHTAEVMWVVASPDGGTLASSALDRTVRLWDAKTGGFLRVLGEIGGSGGFSPAIAFTADGESVVAGAYSRWGGSHVWRVSDGRDLAQFQAHDNSVQSIAVTRFPAGGSGESKTDAAPVILVASTGGHHQDIHLWDATTGQAFGHIAGMGRAVPAVAFSPDSRWVGWGNVNSDDSIHARAPIEFAFDLSEMRPGTGVVASLEWQRAKLTLAGWSAERPETARHTLVVRRDNREISKIERSPSYNWIRCYGFLPEGKVVVGSEFGLALHDASTGQEMREFVGHTGSIWAMATSTDGRMLASASNDQTFRLWNVATGELLLSVFVGRASDGSLGEWVAWTPAGYYKSSPGGDRLFGWHINRGADQAADFVSGWQMRKLFDRPEIVELIPATLSVAAAVEQYHRQPGHRREDPLDISEDFERLRPPSITIYEPADHSTVKTERVRLRAKIFPSGRQPISEVRVLVNGRPPPDFPGLAPAAGSGPAQPRDIEGEVVLEAGANVIEVLAATASASTAPARVNVVRETRSPDAQPRKPDCFYLGIGVAQYEDKSLNLSFATEDATGLADAFKQQEGKLFGKVEPRLVLNRDATPRGIKTGLAWLQKSVTQSDLAVVLVSGHGWPDAQSGFYIAPHDFDSEAPSVTGVSKIEFLERLSQLPCKVLFLLDACHSGRALKGPLLASKWKGLNDGIERVVKEFSSVQAGLVVMASSMGEEKSVEDPAWRHGAFVLALIESLTGKLGAPSRAGPGAADANRDGVLHLDELSVYLPNRVKELTGGNQHALTSLGSVESFPLAIVGGPTLLAADLTQQRPKGVRSETLTMVLTDLKPELQKDAAVRLTEPGRYEEVLRRYYGGRGTVARSTGGELEFRVERLHGVVTGEPNRWEQLTVAFYVEPKDQQVKLRCTGWGLHVKSSNAQPPEAKAYQNSLYPEYESALKRHIGELMTRVEASLRP